MARFKVSPLVQEMLEESEKESTKVNTSTTDNKFNIYQTRGFKNLEEAINYSKSERFSKLGSADIDEFHNWLDLVQNK